MYEYLGDHPQIFVPTKKELHYFTQTALRRSVGGPGDLGALRATVQTEEEYVAYYAAAGSALAAADVSPSYLYYSEVARSIRSFSPEAKVIALLRDPIERAYSQYLHIRRSQRESLTFEEALDAEPKRTELGYGDMWRYVDTSRYTGKLRDYGAVFGRDHLHVVHAEDLATNAEGTMRSVYDFIGVEPHHLRSTASRNKTGEARSKSVARALAGQGRAKQMLKRVMPERVRGRVMLRLVEANTAEKEPLSAETRARLADIFRSEADELAEFLGQPVPWTWVTP